MKSRERERHEDAEAKGNALEWFASRDRDDVVDASASNVDRTGENARRGRTLSRLITIARIDESDLESESEEEYGDAEEEGFFDAESGEDEDERYEDAEENDSIARDRRDNERDGKKSEWSMTMYSPSGEGGSSGGSEARASAAATAREEAKTSAARDEESSDDEGPEAYEGKSGRVYAGKSLFMFYPRNPVRAICIKLVELPQFDWFILGLIAANSVLLCLTQPERLKGRGCGQYPTIGARNTAIENSELVFTVLFSVEAAIKIIAYGFIGKISFRKTSSKKKSQEYLRDSWNVMDFTIVLFSIITQLPGLANSNLSTLRVARILRPLRTISMFPSLRLLVGTMFTSLPMLANVFVFILLFFIIMGILGVQFFAGKLGDRCYDLLPATTSCQNYTVQSYVDCEVASSGVDAILLTSNALQACGASSGASWHCSLEQNCLKYQNRNYGYTSFDTVWWSWLVIFQTITLESWSPVMYDLIDAVSPAVILWFLPVLLLGAFVILNLALAIITTVYDSSIVTELQTTSGKKAPALGLLTRSLSNISNASNTSDEGFTKPVRRRPVWEWFKNGFNTWFGCKAIIQPRMRTLIESDAFSITLNVCIIGNTLCLALEYDGMPAAYGQRLEYVNFGFTLVFMLEMLLKLIGLGVIEYFRDRFNQFDALIVTISAIEMGLSGMGKSNFTMLRAFRVFRILKVLRSWTALQATLKTMYRTVIDLSSFVVILCIFILIFALIGMQVFGGYYCEIDPKPRSNFDTFNNAILTVLQLIAREDWPLVAWDTMYTSGIASVIYFIVALVFGNFLVLNSLVAILLSNFDNKKETVMNDVQEKQKKKKSVFGSLLGKKGDEPSKDESGTEDGDESLTDVEKRFADLAWKVIKRERQREVVRQRNAKEQKTKELLEMDVKEHEAEEKLIAGATNSLKRDYSGAMSDVPLKDFKKKSLFLFRPSNPIRKACFALADDKRFDMFILSLIILSSVSMALEDPARMENDKFASAMAYLDYTFTAIFATEMLLKWISLGVFNSDKNSYVRNGWNILDGLIVIISLVGMALQAAVDVGWIRSLRTLRVLRPLRLLGRVRGLKIVINALLASLPGLGYVLLVSLIVWLIFAIAGMSLFMGKFVTCSDPKVTAKAACIDSWENGTSTRVWDVLTETCNDGAISTAAACSGVYSSSTLVAREWISVDSNFNNFPRAMLTLFEMTSGEGWTVVMYNSADAVSPTTAMRRDSNPYATWYYVAFIVLSNFFLFNMCIGIVIDKFLKLSTSSLGTALMSESQARWVAQQRDQQFGASTDFFSPPPKARWRRVLIDIVEDAKFDIFIMVCIILNTIALMTETLNDSPKKIMVLSILNYIFTTIFAAEAALKISGYFPKKYFSSGWNTFDFIIVITSIIGIFMGSGGGSSAFRALRICRVFRMVKKWKALNTLFQTLVMTIPALGNIGLLLILLFFTYGILGVQLFGRLAYGLALNRYANFKTFGNALSTLLRMMTGEGWQEIMYDAMNQQDCDKSSDCAIGTCCGTNAAPAYFLSFVVFTGFLVLNLLIAVVIDNYTASKAEEEAKVVTEDDVVIFRKVWKKFDPELTGFIQASDVQNVICLTPKPLGLKGTRITDFKLFQFMKTLNLHESGAKFVHYIDVLQALSAKAMGVNFHYLPNDVRKELEYERVDAKRRAISRIKQRSKKRSARVSDRTSSMVRSSSNLSANGDIEEEDFEPVRGVNGERVSISTLTIVLKIQRNFRARKARANGEAGTIIRPS